jgi:hypothetical protein
MTTVEQLIEKYQALYNIDQNPFYHAIFIDLKQLLPSPEQGKQEVFPRLKPATENPPVRQEGEGIKSGSRIR